VRQEDGTGAVLLALLYSKLFVATEIRKPLEV
jgi:hypothetical protein